MRQSSRFAFVTGTMRSSSRALSRFHAAGAALFGLFAAPVLARDEAPPRESPFSASVEAGAAYVALLTRAPDKEGENESPAERTGLGAFAGGGMSYEATRRIALEVFLPASFPDLEPGDPGIGLDYALGATPRRLDHLFASLAVPTSPESSVEHRAASLSVGGGAAFLRPAWTLGASLGASLEAYKRDAPGHDRERWRGTASGDATRLMGEVQLGSGAGVSLVQLEHGGPFVELEVTLVEVSLAFRPRPRTPRRP